MAVTWSFMCFHGAAGDKVEIWAQDLKKNGPIQPLIKDLDARSFGFAVGDEMFLQTNYKAPKGKVMMLDMAKPSPENWREVVPEAENAIDNVTLAGGKIWVTYVKNATSMVKVFQPDGKLAFEPSLPALGSIYDVQGRWENPAPISLMRRTRFRPRSIAATWPPASSRCGRR